MGAIPYTRQRGKAGTFYFKRRAPGDVLDALHATVWREAPTRTHWDISLKTCDWHEAFKRAAQRVGETDSLIAEIRDVETAQIADENALRKRAQNIEDAKARIADLPPAERNQIASAGGIQPFEDAALGNARWARIWEAGIVLQDENPLEAVTTPTEQLVENIEKVGDRASLTKLKEVLAGQIRILATLGLEVDEKLKGFAKSEPGLFDALDDYVEERGLPEQTARQYGYAVRRFTELHGNIPLHKVTADQYRNFASAIRNLPSGRKGGVQDLPFKAAVDRAKVKGLATITDATRSKHMTAIKTVMKHAKSSGMVTDDPLAEIRLAKRRVSFSEAEQDDKIPFSYGDLVIIERTVKNLYKPMDDDFWPPFVAKWQGLRIEEICQLYLVDVNIEAQTIRVTDEGETQKVKNAPSLRTVPIHSELIALGFLDHVKRSNGFLLFETFIMDARGRYGGPYGKRFASMLRDKAKITDSRKTFHSFRHAWTDATRASGIIEEHRRALGGRMLTNDAVENRYGLGYSPKTLRPSLEKLRYEPDNDE